MNDKSDAGNENSKLDMGEANSTSQGGNGNNAHKDNKKAIRQAGILAFIVLFIFFASRYCHQYYLEKIGKASADLQSENVETRLAAVAELEKINEPEAKVALLAAFKDENSGVRAKAAAAIFGWEDERALEALIEAVNDTSDDVRHAAAQGLTSFDKGDAPGSKVHAQWKQTASAALDKVFQAKDYPAIAGAAHYYVRKGKEDTEPVLISALEAYGTKEMAEMYLNCGNEKLSAAAEEWAKKHYYTIVKRDIPYSTSAGPVWGSDRGK